MSRHREGLLLCVAAAACFGANAVFAKAVYAHGGNVPTLLVFRFGAAAVVLWAFARARLAPPPRGRTLVGACVLGVTYAISATCYFAALERISASLTALLLYTYPALVFVTSLALGRERIGAVKAAALGLSCVGAALVLAAGGTGALDLGGVLLALGAAVSYVLYIFVADRTVAGANPSSLTATVFGAGFAALLIGSPLLGGLHPGSVDASGWLAMAGVVLVSTVVPGSLFLMGLGRVGPSTAAVTSTVEPAVTVVLAALFFGERLSPVQVLGGILVLCAVVLLQVRAEPRRVRRGVAADHAPAAATARPVEGLAS